MNLRSFLARQEQRQLIVIEALYQRPNGITLEKLLKICPFSLKTIRNTIAEITSYFPGFEIDFHQNRYYWQAPFDFGLDRFYDYLMQETSEMRFLEHLLFEDCFTFSDCANTLYLSNASFHRLHHNFSQLLAPFNVKIANRPVRIEGNEVFIRALYTLYFCEKRYAAAYLLPDSKSDHALSDLVRTILKENQLPQNYRLHEQLYFAGAVSLWRQNNNHPLQEKFKSNFIKTATKKTETALFQLKDSLLTMNWHYDFEETLWPLCYDYLLISFEHFTLAKKKNARIQELSELTTRFLEDLLALTSTTISFLQLEELVWHFCNENYIYLKNSDFIAILSNSRRGFVLNYEKKFPHIIAGLKQFIGDYGIKNNIQITIDHMYHQLFLIITLLPQVLEYWQFKTRTLILSDVSLAHPHYLQKKLQQHFINQTDFELIDCVNTHHQKMHEQFEAYDLIVSTFSPQEMFGHLPIVTIKPIPDFHDFLKIESALQQVTAHKHSA